MWGEMRGWGWVGGLGFAGEGGAWNTLCLPNSSRMKAESTLSSSSCVLGDAFSLSVSTMYSAQIHETTLIDNRGLAYAEHRLHERVRKHEEEVSGPRRMQIDKR